MRLAYHKIYVTTESSVPRERHLSLTVYFNAFIVKIFVKVMKIYLDRIVKEIHSPCRRTITVGVILTDSVSLIQSDNH